MFGMSDQRVGSFPEMLLRICRYYFQECSSQISFCFNNVSMFLEGHLMSSGSGATFGLSKFLWRRFSRFSAIAEEPLSRQQNSHVFPPG